MNLFEPKKRYPLATGCMLISEPFMSDDSFQRAVILIVAYEPQKGAFGLVLNHPSPFAINDVVPEIYDFNTLYEGGPVSENELFYLHSVGHLLNNSENIVDDICFGGDFERVKSLINSGVIKPHHIMFFKGYSGWDAGQLEQEIENGVWVVSPFNASLLFADANTDIWSKALNDLGDIYPLWTEFPINPSEN